MSEGQQLSVALLLSGLDEVKEISAVFRKLGIIPHFYEDLKTFWSGTLERIPSLCIVDVKKMSEGDLVLCDHPAVKSEKLPLVFFYSKNTEPLLVSTNDFFHLGVLKKTDNYESPLRAILKRLNHFLVLTQENQSLKIEKHSMHESIEKLKYEKLAIEQTDQYQSMVKSVCLQLEEMRGESDFFRAVEKIFQGVDEISEFAMLELSFNGQKLISPISHVQKFRAIPSLWLGQACPKGIELFAQNMATQVAVDIMGGDLVSLLIKGNHAKPDKIMFIKARNELFYNQFDWNMLEAYLNGFYASFKNKLDSEPNHEKRFASTFEAMSFLDQFLFGNTANELSDKKALKKLDYRLVNVDLTSLIELVLKKSNNHFFWSKFEKEFINKLEIQTRCEFRTFECGVNHLSFLVESRDLDSFYAELKDFTSKFAYWKYFEESDGVLSTILTPKVSMVPMSAYAFLKSTQSASLVTHEQNSGLASNKEKLAKLKTKELIWGREAINEI
ncbi:MAG: hypothetical protein Q7U04_01665 [Bacteriovorax sp.]|nr:hypothetical protein [Bacteriovorax sp.]